MYFDNNATTFIDPEVKTAIDDALKVPFGNPSSSHAFGQRAKAILSESRRLIASFLKVKQSQIIFTSGGSEGASLCIQGLIKNPKNAHIITSEIEHPCVYDTIQKLASEGAKVTYLPVGSSGAIDVHDLKSALTQSATAIILMAANNETGVKQDLNAISALAEQYRIPLIVDGVSYLGKENVSIPSGVSLMFFSGHKIHAPQGIGFVYIKQGVRLTPEILGGSQEFSLRGGTENMLGIIALAKAIEILAEKGTSAIEHMKALRDRLEEALLQLPGVKLNGSGERICNTSNLSFGGKDGESLLIAFDQAGIAVSLGSACSSGALEPSRVLLKMGIPMVEARSSLRFSFSRFNTMEEVNQAIEIIKSIMT